MQRLGYVPALDGVRGIAIAAVLCDHFFGLAGGFFGVDLFFVLSGFLITTLLLEDGRLGRFYGRRAARLLPALFPVLIVCSPLGWARLAEGGLYAANFFRAFASPDPLLNTPLDHLWSLAEEEQFYLVWPCVLLFAVRQRRRLMWGLAGLIVLLVCYRIGLASLGASTRRLYFSPDTHADGLLIGCLAALARPTVPTIAGRVGVVTILAFVGVGAFSVSWLSYGMPMFEIAAAVVVVAAADGRLPELQVRPLVWLGLISYSLYLWHQPARWFALGNPWIGLLLALALATASYFFVEQPFRRRVRPRASAPVLSTQERPQVAA